MYRMNKKQEANRFVKECITDALLQMMKHTDVEDISVSDLVKRAGVSRNSFYRNFTSKRNVLEQYLSRLMREWGAEFEARGEVDALAETLLCHYEKHREVYLLLYRRGLSELIYETVRKACGVTETEERGERYRRSMFAGLVFGCVDEWMRRGMRENAVEIVRLLEAG